jgi:hypothetical protein
MKTCQFCHEALTITQAKLYEASFNNPNTGTTQLEDEVTVCAKCLSEEMTAWFNDHKDWVEENGYTKEDFMADVVKEITLDIEDLDEECEEFREQMLEWELEIRDLNRAYYRAIA